MVDQCEALLIALLNDIEPAAGHQIAQDDIVISL